MHSTIEDLSIELWLEIFSYLKVHQQFHAFFNLNKYLNRILFSYRTHLSSKNNDEDSQCLFTHILPCLTHRENVTGLRLENTKKGDILSKADLLYFPRLKTLTLHRLNITNEFLDIMQRNTADLRYLYVSPVVSGSKTTIHQFLEMILSLPNLRFCRLRLGISMSPLSLKPPSKSPMEDLRLIGMNEHCSIDRLFVFTQYLPSLQSLHIIANQLNFTPITLSNICTASISNLTLNLNQFNFLFFQLTSFILALTPHVQELTIICRTPLEDLTHLNPWEWLAFIQSVHHLRKLTLGLTRGSTIDQQTWDKNCQTLTKLTTKYHIHFRIGT